MLFSIIIPVKEINDYIRTAIPHYLEMDFEDYELIIIPDHETNETFPEMGTKLRIIPSGETGPAQKRDMAIEYGRGEYFAFIDDDAYPSKDWLSVALKYFDNPKIGAVGGPAVTAPEDNIWQRGSGKVYESKLCSGSYTYRYLPEAKREVDDLPSVNLIVRADLFKQIGGYDSNYYPGEDTKLCLDIIRKGMIIQYDPRILVFHHRRTLFRSHLKQATNYAKHRGYFAKELPETSRKIAYFVPSLFVIGLMSGPILAVFVWKPFWYFYLSVIALYFILSLASISRPCGLRLRLLAVAGIFATHVGYGINFIRGLCSKELLR